MSSSVFADCLLRTTGAEVPLRDCAGEVVRMLPTRRNHSPMEAPLDGVLQELPNAHRPTLSGLPKFRTIDQPGSQAAPNRLHDDARVASRLGDIDDRARRTG